MIPRNGLMDRIRQLVKHLSVPRFIYGWDGVLFAGEGLEGMAHFPPMKQYLPSITKVSVTGSIV